MARVAFLDKSGSIFEDLGPIKLCIKQLHCRVLGPMMSSNWIAMTMLENVSFFTSEYASSYNHIRKNSKYVRLILKIVFDLRRASSLFGEISFLVDTCLQGSWQYPHTMDLHPLLPSNTFRGSYHKFRFILTLQASDSLILKDDRPWHFAFPFCHWSRCQILKVISPIESILFASYLWNKYLRE